VLREEGGTTLLRNHFAGLLSKKRLGVKNGRARKRGRGGDAEGGGKRQEVKDENPWLVAAARDFQRSMKKAGMPLDGGKKKTRREKVANRKEKTNNTIFGSEGWPRGWEG